VLATRLGDDDTTALPAVFAVSAGNYQRATSPSPQKSWSSTGATEKKTAGNSEPARCKSL